MRVPRKVPIRAPGTRISNHFRHYSNGYSVDFCDTSRIVAYRAQGCDGPGQFVRPRKVVRESWEYSVVEMTMTGRDAGAS